MPRLHTVGELGSAEVTQFFRAMPLPPAPPPTPDMSMIRHLPITSGMADCSDLCDDTYYVRVTRAARSPDVVAIEKHTGRTVYRAYGLFEPMLPHHIEAEPGPTSLVLFSKRMLLEAEAIASLSS